MMMYSQMTSMLYLSWADTGTMGAPSVSTSSWGDQNTYQPYPTPQGLGWGSSPNSFNDFSADSWSPSQQGMHLNKMRGFGSGNGNGGYNRGYRDYGDYSVDVRTNTK